MAILRRATWLVVIAIAVIAVASFQYFSILRKDKKTKAKPKRHLTLRVNDVPAAWTRERFEDDLRSISLSDPALEETIKTLSRVSLIRSNENNACGTVTFYTSLSNQGLLQRLQAASNTGKERPYKFDYTFHGITPLYEHESGAQVDLIAVPGLASHPIGSWKSPSSQDVWLRDYLPTAFPKIRVLMYGYDTSLLRSTSKMTVEEMGGALLSQLRAFRGHSNSSRRPIIFIGHSLGGLLVKEALLQARDKSGDNQHAELFEACSGLLFFGVPNLGLRNEPLQSIVKGQPNEQLINYLVVDGDSEPSPLLKKVSNDFAKCCEGRYPVISFYERKHSPTVQIGPDGHLAKTGPEMLMVTEESATRIGLTKKSEDNIAFDTDHSGLVKYSSRSHELYLVVAEQLKPLIEFASRKNKYTGNSLGTNVRSLGLTSEQKGQWTNLNIPPYASFRSSNPNKPEEGTLQWLIKDEGVSAAAGGSSANTSLRANDFLSWRDSDQSECLLVIGGPGRGKSVLSDFILSHLESNTPDDSKVIYYFCNFRDNETSQNAASLVRSLIVQLCETEQHLFQVLPSDFVETSTRFLSAPLQTLLYFFEKMVKEHTYSKIYCVIDGLDVYQTGMDELMTRLNGLFGKSAKSRDPVFKLLGTTRPSSAVLDSWDNASQKTLLCNPEDIKVFVKSQIRSLPARFAGVITANIEEQLCKERTFLWVDIVFRKIKTISFPNQRVVLEVISGSSQELYQLYADLVRVACESTTLQRLLAWVIYGGRPLSCKEIGAAVSVDPHKTYASHEEFSEHKLTITETDIQREIGTLIDIVDGRIYFIHQSVRDFFEERDPLRDSFQGIPPRLFPVYVCLRYLLHGGGKSDYMRKAPEPFFRYAANNWYGMIESTEDIYDQPFLRRAMKNIFDTTSETTKSWVRANVAYFNHPIEDFSLVRFCIDYGIAWLARALLDRQLEGVEGDFEKDCLSYFVDVEISSEDRTFFKTILSHDRSKEFEIGRFVPEYIMEFSDQEILQILLNKRGDEIQITPEMVEAAAINESHGEAVMRLLLNERGDEIKISPEVMETAASNGLSGIYVVRLLLDKRGGEIQITPGILKAAARNKESGMGVMKLLLEERGNEIQITPEVLQAAIWNPSASMGVEVIRLLLNERGDEIRITPQVLVAVAGKHLCGDEMMRLLLDKYGDGVQITPEVVEAVAENSGEVKLMKLILDERGDKVQITPEAVKAVAKNSNCGEELMRLLLDKYGDEVQITPEVVEAAARSSSGVKLMRLILNERGDKVQITSEAVQAVAKNSDCGEEMMRLLLDKPGHKIQITPEAVEAVANNEELGIEMMRLLLNERGDEIRITPGVLEAAASHPHGVEFMKLIFEERGGSIQVTPGVVETAAKQRHGAELIRLLFDECGDEIQVTPGAVKAAAANNHEGCEIMKLLLDERGDEIQITPKVVEASFWWGKKDTLMTRLLLDKRRDEFLMALEVVEASERTKIAIGSKPEEKPPSRGVQFVKLPPLVLLTSEIKKSRSGGYSNDPRPV
ncbi:hypothetical protein F4861DRAFT_538149 [Xylaria intraflava]|nr:hypothetical protein F4861DRAFT_538149 [Xylaria intraflava]